MNIKNLNIGFSRPFAYVSVSLCVLVGVSWLWLACALFSHASAAIHLDGNGLVLRKIFDYSRLHFIFMCSNACILWVSFFFFDSFKRFNRCKNTTKYEVACKTLEIKRQNRIPKNKNKIPILIVNWDRWRAVNFRIFFKAAYILICFWFHVISLSVR